MTDCLLECLREAKLEKYHRHFVNGGLRHCDALVHLSMQEYPKYGVVSMEDRLKLFKLIQIVKSVQSEGLICHHGRHSHSKQRQPVNARTESVQTKQTNMNKVATANQLVCRRVLPQAPKHTAQQDAPLKRSSSMRMIRQPGAPLRRSASMRYPNVPAPRRSSSATRVEYKANSDSPIFHCRKHLKFTDSDLESDEEDLAKLISNLAEAQVRNEKQQNKECVSRSPGTRTDTESIHITANINRGNPEGLDSNTVNVFSGGTTNEFKGNRPLHNVRQQNIRTFNFETDVKTEISPIDVPVERLQNNNQPSPFELQSNRRIEPAYASSTGAFFCDMAPPSTSQRSQISDRPAAVSYVASLHDNKSVGSSRVRSSSAINVTSAESGRNQQTEGAANARAHLSDKHNNNKEPENSVGKARSLKTAQSLPYCSKQQSYYAQKRPLPDSGEHAEFAFESRTDNGYITSQAHASAVMMHDTHGLNRNANNRNKVAASNSSSNQGAIKPFHHSSDAKSAKPEIHSYFRSDDTNNGDTKNAVAVEKVYHNSGYNYGIPNGDNAWRSAPETTNKSREFASSDRIRVCARKRPLLTNEAKQGERDVIQTQGNTVTVEENKLSVDLSKIVQQVIIAIGIGGISLQLARFHVAC